MWRRAKHSERQILGGKHFCLQRSSADVHPRLHQRPCTRRENKGRQSNALPWLRRSQQSF